MRKSVIIGGGAAVACAVVVGILVFSSLDKVVRKAIETVGTHVAGVPVRVDSVTIGLSDGKASIKGLTVGNPQGFQSDKAFELGEIAVAIDTGSVTSNPFIVKDVTIAGAKVTYEIGSQGSNLDALQRRVSGSSGDSSSPPGSGEPERKMVIDRLAITGGTVTVIEGRTGLRNTATLGTVTLTNLGKDSNGATAGQVAQAVLNALIKSSLKSVQSIDISGATSGAAQKAGSLVPNDAVKGIFGK